MPQARMLSCRFPMGLLNFIFFNYLIFPAALGPDVYSVSNRNEYQKQKKKVLGVERGRRVRLTSSRLAVICMPR
jgi:hypothetical protein